MIKRYTPIVFWLLFLGLAALAVVRASYVSDMSAFLPTNPTTNQGILIEQLTHGSLSRTIVIGIEGVPSEVLGKASKELAGAMRSSKYFSVVQNGDADKTRTDQAFIFSNRYIISPTTVEHFTESGLTASISESIDLLASPLGLFIKKVFRQDPTGELVSIIKNLGLTERVEVSQGVWMGNNGQRALLLAQTTSVGTDTENQGLAVHFIKSQFAKLKEEFGQHISTKMTGAPVFSVNARETIQSQVLLFSMIGLGAISCLYFWVFRSLKLFILGSLPILTGVLTGIATVSLGFDKVHAITIGFGSTLIGEAVDYSIYYFAQAQKENSDWKTKFWATIRLGTLISITGFLALVASDFPGLSQLSLFTISGLVSAILVTRYVLPSLHGESLPKNDVISSVGSRVNSMRTYLAPAKYLGYFAAALMAGSMFLGNGTWSNQISDLSPISKNDKALDQQLRADIGATGTRHLVVIRSQSEESALQSTEALSGLLQPMVEDGTIAGFDAATKLLPSNKTQELRRDSIPAKDVLQTRLSQAIKSLPVKLETLGPFIADAETARSGNLITQESFDGTSLIELLRSMIYRSDNDWISIVPLKDTPGTPLDIEAIKKLVIDHPELGGQYVDLLSESNSMYGQYVSGTLTSCVLGGIAIFGLLVVSLRSIKAAISVTLPLLLSVTIVAGTLGLFGVDLTLLHAVGFLLIVAIGSNYALLAYKDPALLDNETAGALVIACISTVMGFGVLGFTDVPVLKAIGQTVAPGALLTLIFSLLITVKRPPEKLETVR